MVNTNRERLLDTLYTIARGASNDERTAFSHQIISKADYSLTAPFAIIR